MTREILHNIFKWINSVGHLMHSTEKKMKQVVCLREGYNSEPSQLSAQPSPEQSLPCLLHEGTAGVK